MSTHIDVALILWNPDVIDMVSLLLENRNLKSSGIEPCQEVENIEYWLAALNPSVVVFDLRPPYDTSAAVVRRLSDRFLDRAFVFTCADPQLAIKVAPWLSCHPILRKPYEPDEIGRIVKRLVNHAKKCLPQEYPITREESAGYGLNARSQSAHIQ